MRYKLNGQFISIDRKYTTADGVTYPHLRSAEVRQQLGVEEVPDAERKDERFYMHSENADGSFTITPRDLEDGETYTDLRGVERRVLGLKIAMDCPRLKTPQEDAGSDRLDGHSQG
jgi:hypothetical protein